MHVVDIYDRTLYLLLIPRECTPSDADLILRLKKSSSIIAVPFVHANQATTVSCKSTTASEAELKTFLGRLDPDYAQYASAVWQIGVRTAHQLANADKEDLVAAGVTSAIHAKDIKARAGPQG
ncbi:TPA: hypothetical protein ACH3X1_007301 [Trebouxia sp. C0004]